MDRKKYIRPQITEYEISTTSLMDQSYTAQPTQGSTHQLSRDDSFSQNDSWGSGSDDSGEE